MALYITAMFYVTTVVAGYVIEAPFGGFNCIAPTVRNARP